MPFAVNDNLKVSICPRIISAACNIAHLGLLSRRLYSNHYADVTLFFKNYSRNKSGDSSSPPTFSGLIKSFENKQATPSPFDQSSMQVRQSELFLQVYLLALS